MFSGKYLKSSILYKTKGAVKAISAIFRHPVLTGSKRLQTILRGS